MFAQRIELETAQTAENYTLPELVDAPGVSYEPIDANFGDDRGARRWAQVRPTRFQSGWNPSYARRPTIGQQGIIRLLQTSSARPRASTSRSAERPQISLRAYPRRTGPPPCRDAGSWLQSNSYAGMR